MVNKQPLNVTPTEKKERRLLFSTANINNQTYEYRSVCVCVYKHRIIWALIHFMYFQPHDSLANNISSYPGWRPVYFHFISPVRTSTAKMSPLLVPRANKRVPRSFLRYNFKSNKRIITLFRWISKESITELWGLFQELEATFFPTKLHAKHE